MKRVTTGLCLAALLVSGSMNSVLRADDVVRRDEGLFVADESRHRWVTEHNGRIGELMVSGALVFSPCTLDTGEVALPLERQVEGIQVRYALNLNLARCGEGGSVVSQAGRDSLMVMHHALLTGGGGLQPEQRMVSTGRALLLGGANRFTYYLSEPQVQALAGQQASERAQGRPYMNPRDNSALLRLRLDYE